MFRFLVSTSINVGMGWTLNHPSNSHVSLPISVTASFLSAGLVALVLPWGFILTWSGRIVVWGCLGPHMKLVDLVLRAKQKKDGTLNELMRNFDVQSNSARLKREQDLKVKDMKELAFGKYSVQVPSFNLCKCVLHAQFFIEKRQQFHNHSLSSNRCFNFCFVICSPPLRPTFTTVILKGVPVAAKIP